MVTIHDIQPIVRPGDFGRVKGGYSARPAPIRGARVSRGHDPERVRATSGDRTIRHVDDARVVVVQAPIEIARDLDADGGSPLPGHAIEEPFFLYPAITHPHKNHVTLLRAFATVAASDARVSPRASPAGRAQRNRPCAARSGPLGLRRASTQAGEVPRPDLDRLLPRAVALTFPSRHEGYGLPVAEAMALGCPVIASDADGDPRGRGRCRVARGSGRRRRLGGAMSSMLGNDDLRATLIANGRERVGFALARRDRTTARRRVSGRGGSREGLSRVSRPGVGTIRLRAGTRAWNHRNLGPGEPSPRKRTRRSPRESRGSLPTR